MYTFSDHKPTAAGLSINHFLFQSIYARDSCFSPAALHDHRKHQQHNIVCSQSFTLSIKFNLAIAQANNAEAGRTPA